MGLKGDLTVKVVLSQKTSGGGTGPYDDGEFNLVEPTMELDQLVLHFVGILRGHRPAELTLRFASPAEAVVLAETVKKRAIEWERSKQVVGDVPAEVVHQQKWAVAMIAGHLNRRGCEPAVAVGVAVVGASTEAEAKEKGLEMCRQLFGPTDDESFYTGHDVEVCPV